MQSENLRKHNRNKGIARYDDFQMHPEDKKIVEQCFAEQSTNLSNAISPIDLLIVSDLNKIIDNIKATIELERLSRANRSKKLRDQVLLQFFDPRNSISSNKGNTQISRKNEKVSNASAEKIIKRSDKKKTGSISKRRIEGKNKKVLLPSCTKKYKFRSMNLPLVLQKAERKTSGSIEFKPNFLV